MNKAKSARPAKSKGHFNILDIVIVIFILLIAGGAAFYFIFSRPGANNGTDDTETVEYQLWYERQRTELSDRIKVGDQVYDDSGVHALGEVVAVDIRPTVVDSYDKTNEQIISVTFPERYSVYVTIRAKATKSENGYSVGPVRLVVGARIGTRYPDFQSAASCVSVTELFSDAQPADTLY